jgi:hypothetical protein
VAAVTACFAIATVAFAVSPAPPDVPSIPRDVPTPRRVDCDQVRRTVQSQIDATCSCESAATHAEYVRCVANKLRQLSECHKGDDGKLACGPVPRACVGRVRRVASRSACGSNEVTCCIPKQLDCMNDPSPGDGTAKGTCAGTNRSCDKASDCRISRCVSAINAERCQLAGGTVGNGKDCTTACTSTP